MGATSLTEKWDAGVGSFGSQNHFMLGQINEWFFHDLLGIAWDENGPGFRKSIIKPSIVGDIEWAKGSFQSVSGLITVEWKIVAPNFILNINIPANTSATVYIPTLNNKTITEGGMKATKAKGVTFIRQEKTKAIYHVESGKYVFKSQIK
jgi:alpha-L-rhamnosidase